MSESKHDDDKLSPTWISNIDKKARRKIRARREARDSLWASLGMFGLIGWSVAIPMLIGVFLGQWLNQQWPGSTPWTLIFLLAGAGIGCLNAWYWVTKETKAIREEREETNDSS